MEINQGLKREKGKGNPINLKVWEQYFKSLGQINQEDKTKHEQKLINLTAKLLRKDSKSPELDREITEGELCIHINKLKSGKSEGEDRILNEFLKFGSKTLIPYILKLCNGILKVEKVPSSWGSALIIPIYKTGDKWDPNNYRGITLSKNISKFFNRIMN